VDPGSSAFGLFVRPGNWKLLATQDALNTAAGTTPHAVRVYPAKNRLGLPIPNAFIVGFEEALNGDYQDMVFLATNLTPVR